jgi:hypothetical protein
MRVSKSNEDQSLNLRLDTLIAAGVDPEHNIYEDKARGKKDNSLGLAACLKSLRKDDVRTQNWPGHDDAWR